MEHDEFKMVLDNNIELTKQLKTYNNKMAGIYFIIVFICVIMVIILIKVMGWI